MEEEKRRFLLTEMVTAFERKDFKRYYIAKMELESLPIEINSDNLINQLWPGVRLGKDNQE